MKLFVKISLLVCVIFTLLGGISSKIMAQRAVISGHALTQNKTTYASEGVTSQGQPERRMEIRLFHHGIDENTITIPEYSKGQGFAYCYLATDDHSSFKNWRKYLLSSCQKIPGYRAFLFALPLRSPPFYC